ncbi:MAG: hypothetical protein JRI23_19375, partial [Deltaproteobacteria bacterium]|nr:hypothetical protein [Deltaproteobacteria bacterium]MBW2534026.1 hypothetical protein [Deltaproteobacteria bacterium]
DNERAGLINFGAPVTLGNTALVCNALDLAGEPHFGRPFAFDNFGGNLCGCGDATEECQAATAGLAPPGTVAETP